MTSPHFTVAAKEVTGRAPVRRLRGVFAGCWLISGVDGTAKTSCSGERMGHMSVHIHLSKEEDPEANAF